MNPLVAYNLQLDRSAARSIAERISIPAGAKKRTEKYPAHAALQTVRKHCEEEAEVSVLQPKDEHRYRVIFEGAIAPDHEKDRVQRVLATVLNINCKKASRLFSGRKVVLQKQLTRDAARKYAAALERAGALCRIEKERVLRRRAHPSRSPLVCTGCGAELPPEGICRHCSLAGRTAASAKTGQLRYATPSRNRFRAPLLLLLVCAGSFLMLVRPTGPPKYELLQLANTMAGTVLRIDDVLHGVDEFRHMIDTVYGSDGRMPIARYRGLVEQERRVRKPAEALARISAALRARGLLQAGADSRETVTRELETLGRRRGSYGPVFSQAVAAVQALSGLYFDCIDISLNPQQQPYVIRYHVLYRAALANFMAAYAETIEAIRLLDSNKRKAGVQKDLEQAGEYLQRYRTSPLYMVPRTYGSTTIVSRGAG